MIDYNKKDERVEKTISLEHFFTYDMSIKKEMHMLAPSEADLYNNESMIVYLDKLYNGLKDFMIEFKILSRCINLDDSVKNRINVFIDSIMDGFENININPKSILQFYNNNISYMRKEFVDDVKKGLRGYSLFSSFNELIFEVMSINEMLHLLHSYVMNNERIYKSLNIIESKEVCGWPVTLYGNKSDISREIFDNFRENMGNGIVDIVGLENVNKVIMMIRDKGHASSIEITYENENIVIEYFIPKLCNIDMINSLPGVSKINANANMNDGVRGVFIVKREMLLNELYDFIQKIPTDDDMEIARSR